MIRLGRRLAALSALVLLLVLAVASQAYAANLMVSYWVPTTAAGSWAGPGDVPDPFNPEGETLSTSSRGNAVAFADSTNGWTVGYRYAPGPPAATIAPWVASTHDGGGNWGTGGKGTILTGFTGELRGVAAPDMGNVWAVGDGGLIIKRGIDDNAWTQQAVGVATQQLNAVAFADTTHGWAVGNGGVILRTTDGSTWTTTGPAVTNDYFGIAVVDSTHVRVVGSLGTVAVWNGGAWSSFTVGGSPLRSASFVDANHGWVAGDALTMRYTADGGITWTTQTLPVPSDVGASPKSVRFSDAQRGIAVGGHETVWRTANGGVDWETSNFTTDSQGQNGWGTDILLTGVTFVPTDPSTVYVCGYEDPLYVTSPASFAIRGLLAPPDPPSQPTSVNLAAGVAPPSVAVSWVSDGAGTYRYVVERSRDGGAYSGVQTVTVGTNSWSDPLTGSTLAEKWGSTWTYRVKAVGPAEASAYTTSSGLKLDTTKPTTTATVDSTYTASASITIVPADTQSGVAKTEYQIDSTTITSGTVATTSVLGAHSIKHRATDVAGNVGDWSTPQSFAVVATAPAAPSGVTAAAGTPAPRIELTWTDNATNETGYVVERSESGGAYAQVQSLGVGAQSWTDTLGGLTAARQWGSTWTYRVRATNSGGDSASVVSNGLKLDSTPPSTTSDAIGPYVSSATITLTPADNAGGSGIAATYYILDGGSQASGTSVPVAGVGSHTIEFWSVDVAGNAETPHPSVTFSIDAPAPVAPSSVTLAAGASMPSVLVSWTHAGTDTTTYVIERQRNGGTWSSVQSPSVGTNTWTDPLTSFTAAEQWGSTWTYRVKAVGPGGESGFTTSSGRKLDTTAPTTTSDAVPGFAYVGDKTITLAPEDNLGGSQVAATYYILDGGSQTTGTSVAVTGVSSHTIEFWSVDIAGNIETPHKSVTFSITTPPVPAPAVPASVSLAAGAPAPSVTVSWSHDGSRTTDYVIERSGDGGFTWPTVETTGVAAGMWTDPLDGFTPAQKWGSTWMYRVKAIGPGGESGFTTSSGLKLDTTPPVTSASVVGVYYAATVNLTGADTESGVGPTTWTLDGVPGSGTTVTTSTLGPHVLEFRSADVAGNIEDTKTVRFSVLVPTSLSTPGVSPSRPTHGRYATFTAYVWPGGAAVTGTTVLYLYRYETRTVHRRVGGRTRHVRVKYWRLRSSVVMTPDAYGRVSVRYKPRYSGKWKAQAVFYGSATYGAATSGSRSFTVR